LGTFSFYWNGTSNQLAEMPINRGRACSLTARPNPERLSIRLSKELSKGLSETAATIYKLIYVDNYITRGDIAKKVGVSVTAVQKYKKKNPQETDIQNPADFVK
jgi:hypothetical protein